MAKHFGKLEVTLSLDHSIVKSVLTFDLLFEKSIMYKEYGKLYDNNKKKIYQLFTTN